MATVGREVIKCDDRFKQTRAIRSQISYTLDPNAAKREKFKLQKFPMRLKPVLIHFVQEPVYSLDELRSMLDGMMQDFASSELPSPSGGFFAGAPSSPFADTGAAQQQRGVGSASARARAHAHPQVVGNSACLSRMAFSSY